jgi:hypothetical protein
MIATEPVYTTGVSVGPQATAPNLYTIRRAQMAYSVHLFIETVKRAANASTCFGVDRSNISKIRSGKSRVACHQVG